MSYRPRSVPPASDWGRFLVRMRQERDWSATEAHEALHAGLGLGPKSRASYVAIEDGRPLRPREEAFLRDYFKGGPTEQDRDPMAQAGDMGDTPVPGLAAYLERIDALVATVDRLIAQHEADRAIIASLIGLPGGADAERWKSFREWQASNPLPHDPALTGR